jgi:hypothetical protein
MVPLLIERIQKPKVRHLRRYWVVAMVDTWVDGNHYEWAQATKWMTRIRGIGLIVDRS